MLTIQELREQLTGGAYDARLSYLYCRPSGEVADLRQRILHATEGFQAAFSRGDETEVAVYSAPGRTELGGNHTDHQGGKVLTGSVDLDALAVCARNGSALVNIWSEGYGLITVDTNQLEKVASEENTTQSLVRGVLARVSQLGYAVGGFDAYVTSNVPGGSGLSSSACFEVLMGVAANALFCGGALSMAQVAQIGQYAENVYFGKPSGLLDQMGCAMGGVVTIDFADAGSPVYHAVDFDFAKEGYALCIVDTGADHADMTADYAAMPAEMRAVAACFGKEILSQVDEGAFYEAIPAVRAECGDRAVLRAIHYFSDCHRVEQQVAALEAGQFDRFLALVSESGRSSFMYLQNIATFRDSASQPVAVALAMAEHLLAGKGAFRVHGGGFAGTIQAFVPVEQVPGFRAGMDALLGEGACRVTAIRPVGGCTLIGESELQN
ncbi:MAG: galactokinase [Clostridiales bacterium]|nr:galactokinase [Clostridiales bacterium]